MWVSRGQPAPPYQVVKTPEDAEQGLADNARARHVIGCRSTQETRVPTRVDDVAGTGPGRCSRQRHVSEYQTTSETRVQNALDDAECTTNTCWSLLGFRVWQKLPTASSNAFEPSFLESKASYDVASNLCQTLPELVSYKQGDTLVQIFTQPERFLSLKPAEHPNTWDKKCSR
jgi:hypothetical protein